MSSDLVVDCMDCHVFTNVIKFCNNIYDRNNQIAVALRREACMSC